MVYEQVANMSREQIENHPLLEYDKSPYDYIKRYINVENDIKTDDYFTLFLTLASQQIYYAEEDEDNISYLLEFIKEQLTKLLKFVDVETATLHDAGEYMQPTMLKLLLEYFWNTDNRDTMIDGILNLEDEYKNERNVLSEILQDHFDDIDLIVNIARHPNWRSIRSSIEDAIEYNSLLKIVFVMEDIKDIVDEFDLNKNEN